MSFWFCKISFCLDMMQYFCIFPPNFWNTVLYMCVTVPHVAKLLSIGIENLHKTLTLRGGFCSEWVKNLKKTHSLYSYLCFLISNNWLDQKLMSYFLKSQDKISFIFFDVVNIILPNITIFWSTVCWYWEKNIESSHFPRPTVIGKNLALLLRDMSVGRLQFLKKNKFW